MKRAKNLAFVTLWVVLLTAVPVQGQFSSAIDGTVTDATGGVVPGATVTLTDTRTGVTRAMLTSDVGYYRFVSLPPSVYTVAVSSEGFKAFLQQNVTLQVTETRTVNMALEVGETSTQVTVNTAPPAVQLSEASVTSVIGARVMADLPVANRNFANLLGLTPGVMGVPQAGDIFTWNSQVNLNAGGNRRDSNNFIVNGASVTNLSGETSGQTTVMPNIDMIEDVRVQVNNFSAEYGRNAGAQISVVTKQGTNDWHGTIWEFHRNNATTSRTVFQSDVPVYRRNDFGWTLGGPIRKDRTFVFATINVLRAANASSRLTYVPTADFVNWMSQNIPNNLSTTVLTQYKSDLTASSNFQTAGSFAGVDCATLASPSTPISTGIVQGPSTAPTSGQPLPQIPCNLNVLGQATFSSSNPQDGTQWGVRIDHMIGDKDRLYGNYIKTSNVTTTVNPYPAFSQPYSIGSQMFTLDETHTFSPTLLNDLNIHYVRSDGLVDVPTPTVPFTYVIGMELINFNLGPFGFGANQVPQVSDTVSWIRGRHSFKFGGNYVYMQDFADWSGQSSRPAFLYLNPLYYAADNALQEWNLAYDPVTGDPAGLVILPTVHQGGLFFQDDFKVKPNFTLNFGLRWENYGNPSARNDKLTNIVFQGGDTFSDRIANAKVNVVDHLFSQSVKTNFSPRLGFAWDPMGKGKLSIRAGAGLFYDRPVGQASNNVANNLPLLSSATLTRGTPPLDPLVTLGTTSEKPYGYTAPGNLPIGLDSKNGIPGANAALFVVDPDMEIPRVANLFLGVQYSFLNNWTLEADYMGQIGRHLINHPDVNRKNGSYIENNGALVRPNTSFGSIAYTEASNSSAYHGATLAITKRHSHGLTLQGSFTFGKATDYSSSNVGSGANASQQIDITDNRRNRGLADFSFARKFQWTSLWEIPTPRFGFEAANKILGGWELTSVIVLQSGGPFTVACTTPFVAVKTDGVVTGNAGCDYNADGFAYDVPNAPAFGNSLSGLSRSDFLNGIFTKADFPTPALGVQGNLGRNTFFGPGFANVDLGLIKDTRIPWVVGEEGAKFQLRAEFLNAFNRVNLGGVNSDLASGFFGKSTSQNPARTIQFGARIQF